MTLTSAGAGLCSHVASARYQLEQTNPLTKNLGEGETRRWHLRPTRWSPARQLEAYRALNREPTAGLTAILAFHPATADVQFSSEIPLAVASRML